MKLNAKQIGALRWLKAKPGLLLPHTWNHCEQYQQWGTSHASFAALERKGLAEQRDARTCGVGFWHLTKAGEDFLVNLEPCDRLGTNRSALVATREQTGQVKSPRQTKHYEWNN